LGILYAGGKWMGKKCVKYDYVRGFAILQEAGAKSEMDFIISNLKKLKTAGFVK